MVPQTKVFVGSLAQGSKPEELRKLFERFGAVTECDIMNRCGFVHMQTEEQAAAAIRALHNTTFNGSTITVERGRIKERGQRSGPGMGRGGGGMRGGGMRNGGGMDRRGGGGGGPMRGGPMGGRDAPYSRDRGMGGGHMRGGDMRGYGAAPAHGGGMGYERPIERQMGAGGYAEDRYSNYGEDRRGFALMDGRPPARDPYGAAPMYDDRRSYAAPIDSVPPMYDDRRPMYPDERDMMERRPMRGGPMMSSGYDRPQKAAPMGNGDMYSRRSPMRSAPVGDYGRGDPYGMQYPPMPRGGGGAARGREHPMQRY